MDLKTEELIKSTRRAIPFLEKNKQIKDELLSKLSEFFRLFDCSRPWAANRILSSCLEIIKGEFVLYNKFVLDKGRIITFNGVNLPPDFRSNGRLPGRLCYEELIVKRQFSFFSNFLHLSHYWRSDPDLKRHGLKSYAGACVVVAGIPIGSLAVYHENDSAFSQEHAHILEILASAFAFVHERQNIVKDLNERSVHEKMVSEISGQTSKNMELGVFFDYCLQTIGQSLHVDAVTIYWREFEQEGLKKLSHWQQDCREQYEVNDDIDRLAGLPFVASSLKRSKYYACDNIDILPACPVLRCFQSSKLKSILLIQLSDHTRQGGLCVLKMYSAKRKWRNEELAVLKITVRMIEQWVKGRNVIRRLKETQALNLQMKKISPPIVFRVDMVNNRFVDVNDHFIQAMGYTREEILNMNPETLLAPDSRKIFQKRRMAMTSGKTVSNEIDYKLLTKSGNVEWGRFYIQHAYKEGRVTSATVITHNITEQKKNLEQLHNYHHKLKELVNDRTRELCRSNHQLRKEIERHTLTAKELRLNSERLEDLNTAMRVLLNKRNEEKKRSEEHIRMNLKELIEPYLDRLELSGLSKTQEQLIDLIRVNLDEMFDLSVPEFSSSFLYFTPNELQVVNLIRQGRTTKDIANLLNISIRTVEAYRNNIRKKLGLKNKKVNLKTFLLSKK
ncbi:MAG: PAS domain S-box protein [Desulfobacteraceae bacterium]|nr:PAS domain S-box protein [Desulfobacteraceae bacterium]